MVSNSFDFYVKLWELEQVEKIAQTHTSDVFRVWRKEETFVLKVLNEKGAVYEASSIHALQAFDGVGAVKLQAFEGNALLLEDLGTVNLASLCAEGKDQKATRIYAQVVEALQHHKTVGCELENLTRRFASLFNLAKADAVSSSLFVRAAKQAQLLLDTEGPQKLLHGDLHHYNILQSQDRGWVSIDPQVLVGEVTFDLCNSFYNPDEYPEVVEQRNRIDWMAEFYSDVFKIEKKRILQFAFAFGALSAAWQIEDGQVPERRPRIAKMIGEMFD